MKERSVDVYRQQEAKEIKRDILGKQVIVYQRIFRRLDYAQEKQKVDFVLKYGQKVRDNLKNK